MGVLENNEVKYTIVIPVYRGMPMAKNSIMSVLRQKLQNFFLFVIDNGGCLELKNFISSLDDVRIKLFSYSQEVSIEENWQRINSLNLTKYMTIIGHDDELSENYLLTIDQLIDQYPNCSLYGTQGMLVDENRKFISKVRHFNSCFALEDYIGARFEGAIDVSGTGFVYRSADFKSLGGFPKFAKLFFADDAFWIKLLAIGNGVISDESGYKIMIHSRSMSFTQPSIGIFLSEALVNFNCFYEMNIVEDIKGTWKNKKLKFMKKYLSRAGLLVYINDLNRSKECSQIGQFTNFSKKIINGNDLIFYSKLRVILIIIRFIGQFFTSTQIMNFLHFVNNFFKQFSKMK